MCECKVKNEEPFENKEMKYKAGSQFGDEAGTIIKQIVCSSINFVGLMLERTDANGKIINEFVCDYNVPEDVTKHYLFKSEYQKLQSDIEDNVTLTDDEKIKGKSRLLRSFCSAYNDGYQKNNSIYLADVYNILESVQASSIVDMFKTYILLFVLSTIIVVILSILDPERAAYYQAALLGELGGLVMLCFLYGKIKVINRESNEQLKWRYGSKLICSSVFGYIMLLILKAGLILPTIADDVYVRMVCCFFAGFNSKWVPKIASSIAGRVDSKD